MSSSHGTRLSLLTTMTAGALAVTCLAGVASSQTRTLTYEGLWTNLQSYQFDVVPDLDRDDHWDVIVGDGLFDLSTPFRFEGRVRILSGSSGEVIREYLGEQRGEALGLRVGCLDDVTGDGVPDIEVTSFLRFRVLSGRDLREVFSSSILSVRDTMEDMNGDGIPEMLCAGDSDLGGAWHAVRVLLGGTFEEVYAVDSPAAFFGIAAAAVEDIDGDGVEDTIVGAACSHEGCPVGRVFAYSGRSGNPLYEVPGHSFADGFGHQLAALEDLNGNGSPDFVVSAHLSGIGGLFFHDGRTGLEFDRIEGVHPELTRVGRVLTAAGDMNGNGVGDLIVGLRKGNAPGHLWVLEGESREILYELASPYPASNDVTLFARAVRVPGDLDGDDVPDFAVSTASTLVQRRNIDVYSGMQQGFTSFGEPCVPSAPNTARAGRRLVGAQPSPPETPRIGADFLGPPDAPLRIHLSRVAPGLQANLVLGTSKAKAGGPSPLDPSAACPLLIGAERVVLRVTTPVRPGDEAGRAAVTLAIPDGAVLAGGAFYAQWVVRDRKRPGWIATTRGLEIQPTARLPMTR